MNQLVIYVVSGLITIALFGIGYWWKKRNEPKHVFLGRDLEVGSVLVKRIKNIYGPFKVKLANKNVVHFPVPTGFGQQRMDGKGLIFEGDIRTGQLLRPSADGRTYDFAHGIFVEKALADGRVNQIAASARPSGGFTLQHMAVMVGICIILLVTIIYLFAKNGGVAG